MTLRLTVIFTFILLIRWSGASAQTDSLVVPLIDTNYVVGDNVLSDDVHYWGKDSTVMDLINERVFLYGEGSYVQFGSMEVKAGYIAFSLNEYTAFAKGLIDSSGKVVGKPVFKDGGSGFEEDSLGYNFKTKKGISYGVRTEQSQAYLHSAISKKQANNWINIRNGKFTTCNNPNPHYHFHLTKAIVIPEDKIVSGPMYLKVRKVPLPLGLPFGFFPNKKESTHGLLLPGYGNGRDKGFFVQNLGYYIPINPHLETKMLFDVYTGGSWSIKNITNYKKRYKYTGSFNISRTVNKNGYIELPSYYQQTTFNVRWTHTQDPKARPNETFSANVNLGSSQNFRNNLNSTQQDYLTSTFTSAIQWSKSFPGKPFTLAASGNHTQNTQTRQVQMTFPALAFNVSRINLLKKFFPRSPIGVNASVNAEQQLTAQETDFTTKTLGQLMNQANSGIRVSSTASTSWKLGNFVTINPSFSYTGYGAWRIVKPNSEMHLDTISGMQFASNWSTQVTANTRIYGTFVRKGNKNFKAVRHMIQPSAGFSYSPYQNYQQSGYFGTNGEFLGYNPFDAARFAPSSSAQSANLNLSISQNIEAKVRDKSSAKVSYKKVKLLDNFKTSVSRNFMADSLQWSNVGLVAFTTIGKFLTLNYNSTFSMYDRDLAGKKINQYLWDNGKGLARMEGTNLAVGFMLKSKAPSANNNTNANNTNLTSTQQNLISQNQAQFIDFSVPWNMNVNYNLQLSKKWSTASLRDSLIYTHAVTFVGDISLAQKVALSFNGGYNFNSMKMTTTTIGIHVNLHCWELSGNYVPFGGRRSYFIQLNIKSPLLQDLKLQKRGNLGDPQLLY